MKFKIDENLPVEAVEALRLENRLWIVDERRIRIRE